MKYRPDIDGLRAIAVLPVVLFHADIALFGGGFVGVDIFFVISGYLITTLIAQEIQDGKFSLIGFYERRARRILPALFAVMAASLAVAPFVLTPTQLAEFGQSAVATTLFSSNILFWLQSGYFDAPAELKPLLHTWSLAVEEQFYIVFPLALLLIARFAGARWRAFIAAAAVLSFVASSWGAVYNPSAAFYLPQSRMWELMLGALLALRTVPPITNSALRGAASIVGVAMIAWAVFRFTDATTFPGLNAAVPCIGAALLIHCGASGSTRIGRWLSMRAVVFVGLISYSLYLWHWPAFAFMRALLQRDLSALETIGVLVFSVVAAVLSWRFVERPFRGRRAVLSRRALFSGAGTCAVVIVALGAVGVWAAGGQIGRLGQTVAGANPYGALYNYRTCFLGRDQRVGAWQEQDCFLNSGAPQNALLWGDSFAAHYVPGLVANGSAWSHNILQYTSGSCAPIFGWGPLMAPNCEEFNAHVEDVIAEFDITTVILAAQWDIALEFGLKPGDLAYTIDRLRGGGLEVVVIGQTPVFRSDTEWLAARGQIGDSAPVTFDANINQQILAGSEGALFIDPLPLLCDGLLCRFRAETQPYFGDSNHLTVFGSNWFVEQFRSQLAGVL